jgi:hypothetical protein
MMGYTHAMSEAGRIFAAHIGRMLSAQCLILEGGKLSDWNDYEWLVAGGGFEPPIGVDNA